MPAVTFEQVSFGRTWATRVLDGFSLTVGAGEVVALVGASGAGKTTALKLVNRLLLPDSGSVKVQGRDTREWDPIRLRRTAGYVIQDAGLFPHLSVADNIAVVPRLERWPEDRVASRTVELLELMGLPPDTFASRWPDELSGGQRQRVGVARALATDPPVLLLDEPFGALDPLTRRQVQRQFSLVQSRLHKSVILVTHDLGEAMSLGDRIAVVHEGRVAWSGSPGEIGLSNVPHVRELGAAVKPLVRTGLEPASE
jgi:osmoprotectant transport system ATP-binding protein